jgi:GTP:adenosylcobinamide-phosphate guanylyltransferase
MTRSKETHNALELLLTAQLFIDIFDNYNLKGIEKKYGKMFHNALEAKTIRHYDEVYAQDAQFALNSLNIKQRLITQIADLNEADAILLSEFVNKFIDNIEIARKKGVVFFDKIL